LAHDWVVVDTLFLSVLNEIRERSGRIAAQKNRRLVVGLAGAVSVGKTTFAATVADELRSRFDRSAGVVGTDGFLLPNAVLEPRGLMYHKGLPETYDVEALQGFLTTAASPAIRAVVPVYSHEVFDTVGTQTIDLPEIVLVEGINILGDAYAPLLDFRVYLDADEQVVIDWFVRRFLKLIAEAESDPSSFYARFVALSPDERNETARGVWDAINGPNLHHHIAPTRENADLILRLRSDHHVESIDRRN
jgi:type I pantothenate kinase